MMKPFVYRAAAKKKLLGPANANQAERPVSFPLKRITHAANWGYLLGIRKGTKGGMKDIVYDVWDEFERCRM